MMWYESFEFDSDLQGREAFNKIAAVVAQGGAGSVFYFKPGLRTKVYTHGSIGILTHDETTPQLTVMLETAEDELSPQILQVANRLGGRKTRVGREQFSAMLAARFTSLADCELHT